MDDLLLRDQVACLLDQAQESIDVLRPLVQHLVGVLGLCKRYDASRSVNLGVDGLGDNQLGEECFAVLVWQVEKLCESLCRNASVVLGNDPNIL